MVIDITTAAPLHIRYLQCGDTSSATALPRHRHQEFIRFLKKFDAETCIDLALQLIVDTQGTHRHPKVKVEKILAKFTKCKESLGALH